MIKIACTALLKVCQLPALTGLISFVFFSCAADNNDSGIDRYSLVNRHNVLVQEYNPLASLSVGNGNFAFTTGITGLQTV